MKIRVLLFQLFVTIVVLDGCSSAIPTPPPVIPTPTSAPGMGRVTGVLQVGVETAAQPSKNMVLYLAETLKDTAGNEVFGAMDRVNSPRAITDGQGRFVFSNVPPGKYGIVLDLVTNSYLLPKPGSTGPLFVQVEPDQVSDMGTLTYASLTVPPTPATYPYP